MDLAALVRDLTENLRPAFDERDLRLELQLPATPVRLLGSPRLLEEAVANLLDNALRITPCGGQIRVELAPPANGRLTLSVADSGPGFPSHLKPGYYLSSDQSAIPTSTKEGTGLGLLIVSNIVHAHAGTVRASVSEWNGARFTLGLPALV